MANMKISWSKLVDDSAYVESYLIWVMPWKICNKESAIYPILDSTTLWWCFWRYDQGY